MKIPSPPKHLSAESTRLWKQIHEEYVIEDRHGLMLLECALESLDRVRQAQEQIRQHGVCIVDRYDQLKTNPACAVERDQKTQMIGALKQLGLNTEVVPEKKPGRPPGR
jgi:P27 family predicted phage terminase small subunit